MSAKTICAIAAIVLGHVAAYWNWAWYYRVLRGGVNKTHAKLEISILSLIVVAFGVCSYGWLVS